MTRKTHITESERQCLVELQLRVTVFTRYLQRLYGQDIIGINPETGELTRSAPPPPQATAAPEAI